PGAAGALDLQRVGNAVEQRDQAARGQGQRRVDAGAAGDGEGEGFREAGQQGGKRVGEVLRDLDRRDDHRGGGQIIAGHHGRVD
nr:hypothetical protein [Tanacetum cinerariifolium]